jgi:hypothetical protein
MPRFLEGQQARNQGQQGQGEGFTNYLREYQAFGDEFQATMCLQDFCTIKYRNRPRDFNRGAHVVGSLRGKLGSCPFLTLMAIANPLLGHGFRS